MVKATFHYSSQLQTWFSTRFAARYSTSSCGFVTRFRLFFVENLVANLLHQSRHVTYVRSSLGFKQVCSWLSTCFRHAFDLLATCFRHAHASRKPGLQLARIMKCGLNYVTLLYVVRYSCLTLSCVRTVVPPFNHTTKHTDISIVTA